MMRIQPVATSDDLAELRRLFEEDIDRRLRREARNRRICEVVGDSFMT